LFTKHETTKYASGKIRVLASPHFLPAEQQNASLRLRFAGVNAAAKI
jgi:hypothetical protein